MNRSERLLATGGVLTSAASLLHVAIIVGGAEWYRFFGAGERMARLADRGALYPTIITSGIAIVLAVWAMYAFSGAGLIRRLPLVRPVLWLIAGIFLVRGIFGIPLVLSADHPYANELKARMTFMAFSSLVCIVLGLCYAIGARFATVPPASGAAAR